MPSVRHRYDEYGPDGIGYAEVDRFKINYKEVFVMEFFYKQLYHWLTDNGYASEEDADFPEVFYLQKETPAGKEIWIRWRCKKPFLKNGSKAITFWRADVDIDIHVLTLKEVEVVYQNQKFKADKGEVEADVVANLIMDADKSWEKNSFLKMLKPLFIKRIWITKRKMIEDQIYLDMQKFQDTIKTHLKLETYLSEKDVPEFWPKRSPE